MKPRLTIVLELRIAAEEVAKREVGRLESERRARLDAIEAHHRRLSESLAAGVPLALREQFAGFRSAMLAAIAEGEAGLTAHDAVIATARDALALAHRGVKAIEAIRTRDSHAESRRQHRRDGRANDEHAARARLEVQA